MPTPKVYESTAERMRAYRLRKKQAAGSELDVAGVGASASLGTAARYAHWNALIKSAQAALQTAHDQMEAYFADRSDRWQESDRGEQFQERIDSLENLLEDLAALE